MEDRQPNNRTRRVGLNPESVVPQLGFDGLPLGETSVGRCSTGRFSADCVNQIAKYGERPTCYSAETDGISMHGTSTRPERRRRLGKVRRLVCGVVGRVEQGAFPPTKIVGPTEQRHDLLLVS